MGYCRRGGIAHAPAANRPRPYDIVFGPISLIGQTHTIANSDQVCFPYGACDQQDFCREY